MLRKSVKSLIIGTVFVLIFSSIATSYAYWEEPDDYRSQARSYFSIRNYLQGYGDSYGLEDYLTREQMAVFIYRINDEPDIKSNVDFTDKSDISGWAYDAIQAGIKEGYLSGYPDGSFKPQAYVKTNEAVKMAIGAFKGASNLKFPDEYMSIAKDDELLYAVSCDENENITREDVITMLYNAGVNYNKFAGVERVSQSAAR